MILEITFIFMLVFIGYRAHVSSFPVNQEGGDSDPFRFIRFWTIIDFFRNTWIFR